MADPYDKYFEDDPKVAPAADPYDKYFEDDPAPVLKAVTPLAEIDPYDKYFEDDPPIADEPPALDWYQPVLDAAPEPEWRPKLGILEDEWPQPRAETYPGRFMGEPTVAIRAATRPAAKGLTQQRQDRIEDSEINYNRARAKWTLDVRKWESGGRKGPKPVAPISPIEIGAEAESAEARELTRGFQTPHLVVRGASGVALDAGGTKDPLDVQGAAEAVLAIPIGALINIGRTVFEAGEWAGEGLAVIVDPKLRYQHALKTYYQLKHAKDAGLLEPPHVDLVDGKLFKSIFPPPSPEAVEEVRRILTADVKDPEKLKDIQILATGEEIERPGTYPRFRETAVGAVREIVGLATLGLQLPGAVGYIAGKTPYTEKAKTIGNFAGHMVEYYTDRFHKLKRGDWRSLIEEAPIGSVFDLGMALSAVSKAAIAAEARLIRQVIEQTGERGAFRLGKEIPYLKDTAAYMAKTEKLEKEGKAVKWWQKRTMRGLSDYDLVQHVRHLAAQQKGTKAKSAAEAAEAAKAGVIIEKVTPEVAIMQAEAKALKAELDSVSKSVAAAEKRMDDFNNYSPGDKRRIRSEYQEEWARADRASRQKTYQKGYRQEFNERILAQIDEAKANKRSYERLSREADEAVWLRETLKRDKLADDLSAAKDLVSESRGQMKKLAKDKAAAEKRVGLADVLYKQLRDEKASAVDLLKAKATPKITMRKGLRPDIAAAAAGARVSRAFAETAGLMRKTITPWGALTVGNAMKNRMLSYEHGAAWLGAGAKARLRNLLRDPDLIVPEMALGELRNAQGALDDFVFVAAELYKKVPERFRPTVNQAIHFEHAATTRYFKWAEDSNGVISYKVKPEYLTTDIAPTLKKRAAVMNEWAAPIATLIRQRVTRAGVDLDVFENASAILGRLWAPNMMKGDLTEMSAAVAQRIRGAALQEASLRRAGVSIEAREWPAGKDFPKRGPASIAAQKTNEAKIMMIERQKRFEGGWGMTTDLAEELLYGVADAVRDFALVRAFKNMAKDTNVAIKDKFFRREYIDADGIRRIKTVDARPGWEKLSDVLEDTALEKIAKKARRAIRMQADDPVRATPGGRLQRYGDITDMYVHPDLAHFIRSQEKWAKWHRTSRFAKALSFWKAGKTILSPATHATNFLSNALILAPMAGISPWNPANFKYYERAAKEMISGKNTGMWKEFIVNGGRGRRGMAQRSEMAQQADSAAAMLHGGMIGRGKNFLAELETAMRETLVGKNKIKTAGGRVVKISRFLYQEMGVLYQSGDDYYRFSLYLKLRDQGVAIDKAIKAARKSFADYENLAGIWMHVKNSTVGIPFTAFDVRTSPRVAKWITENPHKGALLLQLSEYWTMRNMAESGVDTNEQNALMSSLPSYMQMGHVPWSAISPGQWNRKKGSRGLVGVGKYIPALKFIPDMDELDLFSIPDGETKLEGLYEYGMRIWGGGGPAVAGLQILGGRHPFYKKDIVGAGAKVKLLLETWGPNIPLLPTSYSFNRLKAAMEGKPRSGRTDVETIGQAVQATIFGIKDVEFTIDQLITNADRTSPAEYRDINTLKILKQRLREAEKAMEGGMERLAGLGHSDERINEYRMIEVKKLGPLMRQIGAIQGNMKRRRGLDAQQLIGMYEFH